MRWLWAALLAPLPWSIKRRLGTWLCGWDVHPTAYVGRSIVMVGKLTMGPRASIAGFNIIRDLAELRLDEGASIASRNRITGWPLKLPPFDADNRNPSLIMGRRSAITMAHEIDCSDLVEMGEFSSLAGFNTTILTHSLDLVRDRWRTAPVTIGAHSAVMTGSILLSGTSVPARSVISAGSVVNTQLTKELMFYRGNPAEPVRELRDDMKFFHRTGPMGLQ